jgi:hypothetical protein
LIEGITKHNFQYDFIVSYTMKNFSNRVYNTVTGRTHSLDGLTTEERKTLQTVLDRFDKRPEWSEFASWWMEFLDSSKIKGDSVVFKICDDLEARLGIVQGKVAPPDYRDYLASLIELRYGTRYKFSKATGIDQGQLSRVFARQADISLDLFQRMLAALSAALVIEPIDTIKNRLSPEEADRLLSGV